MYKNTKPKKKKTLFIERNENLIILRPDDENLLQEIEIHPGKPYFYEECIVQKRKEIQKKKHKQNRTEAFIARFF